MAARKRKSRTAPSAPTAVVLESPSSDDSSGGDFHPLAPSEESPLSARDADAFLVRCLDPKATNAMAFGRMLPPGGRAIKVLRHEIRNCESHISNAESDPSIEVTPVALTPDEQARKERSRHRWGY